MKTIQELFLTKAYRIVVIAFIACGLIFLSFFLYSYHKNKSVTDKYTVQVLINTVSTLIQNNSLIIKKLENDHLLEDIHFLLADTFNDNKVITKAEYIKSNNNIDSNVIDGVDFNRVYVSEKNTFTDIYIKYNNNKNKNKNDTKLEYFFTEYNKIPHIEFLLPIYTEDNIFLGLLKYTASMQETEQKMLKEQNNYYSFIFLFGSIFTIVILVTLIILHRIIKDISIDITNPIQDLILASDKIASGEYSSPVEVEPHSEEVHKLGNSIELMREKTNTSLLRMKELNETLEDKVKQRTLEVEKLKAEETQRAHDAGASSVIESILHNIGNVLNTINVSNYDTMNILANSKHEVLSKLTDKFNEILKNENLDINNLEVFIKAFKQTHSIWQDEITSIHSNQTRMDESIEIIKDIIIHQRSNVALSTFKEEFNILELTQQIIENYKSPNTKILLNQPDKDIIIYGEKNKLHQVITNIIVNAIEAQEQGKPVLITIDITEDEDSCIISFKDNGVGIDDSLKNKIFQPRFTTKNRGSGFGLHSCMNIMTDINGKLLVDSEGKYQGSTFTMHIPLSITNAEQTVELECIN